MKPEPCVHCGTTENVTSVQLDCHTWKPICDECRRRLDEMALAWIWGLRNLAADAKQKQEAA